DAELRGADREHRAVVAAAVEADEARDAGLGRARDELPELGQDLGFVAAEDLGVRDLLPVAGLLAVPLGEDARAALRDEPHADRDDLAETGIEPGTIRDRLPLVLVAFAREQVAACDLVDLLPGEAGDFDVEGDRGGGHG